MTAVHIPLEQPLAPRLTRLGQVLARPHRKLFLIALAISGLGTVMLFTALGYTFLVGIGVWGNNIPTAWAFDITNFVWWIGIGHAGTFISAILYLFEQKWRTTINRFAEAMTLFAVANAAIFPLAHMGRPWFFYWLIPYPSLMGVWPQFRSALAWDVVAVSTYGLTSLLFWYMGLVPDFAAARDHLDKIWKRRIYGVLALGWRGTARHWAHYRVAYGLLAGLATPLVLSVHSVVSLDFTIAKTAGWHSTIFPPYFVAGAIFSGFAMVMTLLVPTRRLFGLNDLITDWHLDAMAKLILLTGSIVGYAYIVELFLAWWSVSPYEHHVILEARPFGQYAFIFWLMVLCNVLTPQLYWSRRVRRSELILFVTSIMINIGMWCERFNIIASSLDADFLTSSWARYVPSPVDWMVLTGTLCFFTFAFLLFLRTVPFIPIWELSEDRHHG
jgi:Ni/Fe-hydrogenase subunit HybB-like protein